MQGYDLDIKHIAGKNNPANSLSRQDRKDALGMKSNVKDANADLVQRLRVPANADDATIQEDLI